MSSRWSWPDWNKLNIWPAWRLRKPGSGVLEDKALKNMVATEFVYNYVKDKRTVGVIREFPERGLVEVAEPIGVIFSLTPITNPTSTVLFKCIMAIKTRNAVIFSPHPSAWRCCCEAVRIMYEAAVKHGAPEGVFTCLESHTLQDNAYLMHHKDVGLIDATGGPGVVKAAYSSGKPALGVGPGNTPVYLEKTADLNMAVVDIITSKTFDNGTICASEQTVVIDDEIYDLVLKKFADLGAHICNEKETELLGRTVIDPETGFMQPMAVGQKATDIARMVGLTVKPNTKLLIAPIHGVGREYPLSVEKLFPVLAVYRAKSVDEALKVCVDVNHAGGLGHTAVVFSRNDEIIRKFGEVINAGRIIVNSPGSIGALGGVYNDMVPTFSFGCGTGGGNSTMDNVNVYQLPQHQTRGAEDTSAYVVPRSQSDLLQHERGGEPAPVSRRARPSSLPIRPWSRSATSTSSGATFRRKLWSMSRSFPMPSPKSRSSCREWRRSISTKRTRSSRWAAGR